MKINFKILALLAFGFLILVFFFLPKSKQKIQVKPGQTIVAFGDSLVYGVGASPGKNWVALLSNKIGNSIVNLGVSGETTAGGLARLETDVLSKNPDVVFLLLGGNDALRQVSTEQTFANLEQIILKIKSVNPKTQILLLGIRGGVLFIGKDYSTEFEKLAKKTNVTLVPDVLDGLFGNSKYMSDTVHPNDAGYQKITEKLEKYIEYE